MATTATSHGADRERRVRRLIEERPRQQRGRDRASHEMSGKAPACQQSTCTALEVGS